MKDFPEVTVSWLYSGGWCLPSTTAIKHNNDSPKVKRLENNLEIRCISPQFLKSSLARLAVEVYRGLQRRHRFLPSGV